MPTDYKKHANRKQKKSLPGFVWFVAGLAIGLFVAFIIYLDGQDKNSTGFGAAVQKELEKIKQKPRANKKIKEPRFNFYTILPELEVLIPESEINPASNSQPEQSNNLKKNKRYIIQAGSFKNKADAEKRKAALALLGFQAKIRNVTINGKTWHRVRIGPYDSTKDLYQIRIMLKNNDISAMAMELKPE